MAPSEAMNDDRWSMLVQGMAEHFGDVTISRGFQYFKQGRVKKLALAGPDRIEAEVDGTKRYRVGIRLDDIASSGCSCPVQRSCKHMAAVLLAYAHMQGRPVHPLMNARSAALPIRQEAKAVSRFDSDRKLKIKELAARIHEANIAVWREMFELNTQPFADMTRNSDYVKRCLGAIFQAKPPLPFGSDRLFKLNAYLFVLERLAEQPANSFADLFSHLGYFTHLAASELHQAAVRLFEERPDPADEPELRPRLEETLDLLRRQMLTESPVRTYFADYYFLFWNWLYPHFCDQDLYREELRRLEAAASGLTEAPLRVLCLVAQSRMHFFLSDDRKAWKLLRTASESGSLPADAVLDLFSRLSRAQDWPRLAAWLTETGPLLDMRQRGVPDRYSEFWNAAVRHVPEAEPRMWEMLELTLPAASRIYEENLRSRGKWREWMDLQLSLGREPLEYRASELQELEKQAPEMLLPFYHQAVERYVLLKNRDGYKAAVKLLKRLSRLYKKLKREARWERFFSAFVERHSRLRALQEELRKGKLIS